MPHPERGRSRHELRSKYAVVVKVRLYPRDLGKPLLFHLWLMRFDNNPPTIAQKNPCHAPDARMVKESPFRRRPKIAQAECIDRLRNCERVIGTEDCQFDKSGRLVPLPEMRADDGRETMNATVRLSAGGGCH
jgi:hypothetical protein